MYAYAQIHVHTYIQTYIFVYIYVFSLKMQDFAAINTGTPTRNQKIPKKQQLNQRQTKANEQYGNSVFDWHKQKQSKQ